MRRAGPVRRDGHRWRKDRLHVGADGTNWLALRHRWADGTTDLEPVRRRRPQRPLPVCKKNDGRPVKYKRCHGIITFSAVLLPTAAASAARSR
jgi:hypothetical protein